MTTARSDTFTLTLARALATEHGEHELLTHLTWATAAQDERVVQVYVDGELTDVADAPGQRDLWLVLDRTQPHHIALLAVDPADAWTPHALPDDAGVALTLLRDERLPPDTQLTVTVDGRIEHGAPLWPDDAHRGGFGALFGVGGFGTDAATGAGLGLGDLGLGPLGADAHAWRFRCTGLPAGTHELTVTAADPAGAAPADPLQWTAAVRRPPPPAATVTLAPDFTLSWTR